MSRVNAFWVLLIFFCFNCVNPIQAQSRLADSILNGLRVETKLQYGSIFPHHSSVLYLLEDNIVGVEINLSTESNNRHSWEGAFRNPRYGVAYSFQNVGNNDVLGNLHAFYGYIDVPFHTPKRKHTFSYQVDFGLGYFTQTYHPYDNPLNLLISSHLNVYIGFDLIGRYKIGKKNELKTAIELTHCSNGKTKTPNLGANMLTLSAAWLYSITPARPYVEKVEITDYKRHFVEFVLSAGGKRDDNMSNISYFVSSFVSDYYYAYSPKYSVGIGGDFFYDASLAQHQEYFEEGTSNNTMNSQLGLHVGFRVRYNNLYVVLNMGHYVVYDYLRHGKIYSRLGLRYAVTNNVMLNLSLKAHNTIADFIEMGVGYRLNSKGR